MGINPAVSMANYYLFYNEYQFLKRMLVILRNTPPVPGGHVNAGFGFEPEQEGVVPSWVANRPEDAAYDGNLVMHVLNAFRFTRRFVDDLTSACNPFSKYLLYTNNSILGGVLTGIYPANGLVLEPTNAYMCSLPTLDLRIATTSCWPWVWDGRTGLMILCVKSICKLYDKRRENCYDDIPITQYTHASSNVGQNVGRSILMGQLHRYRELIQDRDNFICECGLLLARMHTYRGTAMQT